MHAVRLMIYDLSHGTAPLMVSQLGLSSLLGGMDLALVPHTGVEVFEEEWFYGGGIQRMAHARVVREYGMTPVRIEVMGRTRKSKNELIEYLKHIQQQFTGATYDLVKNNCNHFSEMVTRFLLEDAVGIPDEILKLPERLLATPLGAMIGPMFMSMNERMQRQLVPFNNNTNNAGLNEVTAPTTTTQVKNCCVRYQMAGSDTVESVVVSSSPEIATVGDFQAALFRKIQYGPADQRVISRGKLLTSDTFLQDALGSLMIDSTVVHVSIRPGAEKVKTSTLVQSLAALETSCATASPAEHLRALGMLQRIVQNITENPHEAKYRSVRVSNSAFHSSLGRFDGGIGSLQSLGFVLVDQTMRLDATQEQWPKIVMGVRVIVAARRRVAKHAMAPFITQGMSPEDLVSKSGLDAKDTFVLETAREMLASS